MTKQREFKYTSIHEALDQIKRNGGRVKNNIFIQHPKPGLKLLSALDYLVNYHGYTWIQGD